MVFPLIDAALRGMVLVLLVLLAVMLRRTAPLAWPTRIWTVFSATLAVQVISSNPLFEHAVPVLYQAPCVALSVGNAVLFWVMAQALFQDDFRLRPVHLGVWLLAAALGALNCLDHGQLDRGVRSAEQFGLRLLPVVCAVMAAVAAGSDWRSDLVATRRWLRAFILAGGIGYTLLSVLLRLITTDGLLTGTSASLDMGFLFVLVAVVTLNVTRRGTLVEDLFPTVQTASRAGAVDATPSGSGTAPDAADARLAATLQRVMRDEHAYRLENLTVAALALRLAVPEYRLRRVINQRLGHRNFNAFVNGLRLDEATATLADPQREPDSIMDIALAVGFQSIGPFNRAFKARYGVTPSEFRRARLADSSNQPAESAQMAFSARRLEPDPAS